MFDYTGFGENVLTFKCTENTAAGDLVIISDNDTVSPAVSGQEFFGVAVSVRNGIATVATEGFITAPYSGGAPALGATYLAANGEGGVISSDGGKKVSVLTVNPNAHTVGFIF